MAALVVELTATLLALLGHLLLSWKLADTLPEHGIKPISVDMSAFESTKSASGSRASFLETSVGTAALLLVQHLRRPTDGTEKKVKDAAGVIRDAIQVAINEEPDDDGCELLYGRAGLLYALLYLRTQLALAKDEPESSAKTTTLAQLSSDRHVRLLVDDIVARGKLGAKAYARELLGEGTPRAPALMWRWHGKRYLGAAHGVGTRDVIAKARTRRADPLF